MSLKIKELKNSMSFLQRDNYSEFSYTLIDLHTDRWNFPNSRRPFSGGIFFRES